jgi:hypothetical protein
MIKKMDSVPGISYQRRYLDKINELLLKQYSVDDATTERLTNIIRSKIEKKSSAILHYDVGHWVRLLAEAAGLAEKKANACDVAIEDCQTAVRRLAVKKALRHSALRRLRISHRVHLKPRLTGGLNIKRA